MPIRHQKHIDFFPIIEYCLFDSNRRALLSFMSTSLTKNASSYCSSICCDMKIQCRFERVRIKGQNIVSMLPCTILLLPLFSYTSLAEIPSDLDSLLVISILKKGIELLLYQYNSRTEDCIEIYSSGLHGRCQENIHVWKLVVPPHFYPIQPLRYSYFYLNIFFWVYIKFDPIISWKMTPLNCFKQSEPKWNLTTLSNDKKGEKFVQKILNLSIVLI